MREKVFPNVSVSDQLREKGWGRQAHRESLLSHVAVIPSARYPFESAEGAHPSPLVSVILTHVVACTLKDTLHEYGRIYNQKVRNSSMTDGIKPIRWISVV